MIFLIVFIIMLFWGFVKGTKGMRFSDLFVDHATKQVSHTKYWSNVAYLSATIAFLTLNLFFVDQIKGYIEVIWMIYLGVVASNAAFSKYVNNKAGQQQQRFQQNDYSGPGYSRYNSGYDQGPDDQNEDEYNVRPRGRR